MNDQILRNDLHGLTLAIEELRRDQDLQLRRLESVQAMARSILASGSLIIALVSAFQIVVPTAKPISPETYRTLFILALVLYVTMIACCIFALWPKRWASPARASGEDLFRRLEGQSELEARRIQLTAYRRAEAENRGPARRIQAWTMLGGILLPVVVVVLLFLSFNVP